VSSPLTGSPLGQERRTSPSTRYRFHYFISGEELKKPLHNLTPAGMAFGQMFESGQKTKSFRPDPKVRTDYKLSVFVSTATAAL